MHIFSNSFSLLNFSVSQARPHCHGDATGSGVLGAGHAAMGREETAQLSAEFRERRPKGVPKSARLGRQVEVEVLEAAGFELASYRRHIMREMLAK